MKIVYTFFTFLIISNLVFAQTNTKPPKKAIIFSNDQKKNSENSTSSILSSIATNEFFIKGQFMEIGINTNGTLGTIGNTPTDFNNSGRISIVSDIGKDGWSVGTPPKSNDYFLPGMEFEGFKVQIGSLVYSNINNGIFEITGNNISLVKSGSINTAIWEGQVAGIFSLNQKIEFIENESYLKFTIKIKNISANPIPVYYSKMSDPDQESVIYGTPTTLNSIIQQVNLPANTYSLVNSKGTTAGIYLGYLSNDTRSKAAISSPWNLTPKQNYDGTGGAVISGSLNGDHSQIISFYEPNLLPGQETEFVFYILTIENDVSKVICEPSGQISALNSTIYQGQTTDLILDFSGASPWTYLLNGVEGSSSSNRKIISVNPNVTTEYDLKGVTNACGKSLNSTSTSVVVQPCSIVNATLSGSARIPIGSSTNIKVDFTGIGPWNIEINNVLYTTNNNPFLLNVSPTDITRYIINSVSNFCGIGTVTGEAIVNPMVECDGYESNNSIVNATIIPSLPYLSNQMCFHRVEDKDWFKFSINGKDFYVEVKFLENTALGNYSIRAELVGGILNFETIPFSNSNVDTFITLFDSDKSTILASNDDGGQNLFSKILINICPANLNHSISSLTQGIYFAKNNINSSSNLQDKTYYFAGNSINLNPGFQVGENELFLAEINACRSSIPGTVNRILTLQPGPLDGKDADVVSSIPDRNYGNNEYFDPYCWTAGGNIVTKRVFLEFNISEIPINATIDSAKLNLYFSQKLIEDFNYYFTGHTVGNNEMIIYRNTSSWNENTINWINKPNFDNTIFKIIPPATNERQNYLNIDVKNLVVSMKENGNYGFQIRHTIENPYKITCLTSSEEINPAIRPRLVVYYH